MFDVVQEVRETEKPAGKSKGFPGPVKRYGNMTTGKRIAAPEQLEQAGENTKRIMEYLEREHPELP